MRPFLVITLLFVFGNIFCQKRDIVRNPLNSEATMLYPNVVKITSTVESGRSYDGFGIIIGEIKEHLIIVTADHIIRGEIRAENPQNIKVLLFNPDQEKQVNQDAYTIDAQIEQDFSFIKTIKPLGFNYNTKCYDPILKSNNKEFSKYIKGQRCTFIGYKGDWDIPVETGFFEEIDPDDPINIIYKDNNAFVGLSGAPVFSRRGIIGMHTEQDNESKFEGNYCINLGYILNIANKLFQFDNVIKPNSIKTDLGLIYEVGADAGFELSSGINYSSDSSRHTNYFLPLSPFGSIGISYKDLEIKYSFVYNVNYFLGEQKSWNNYSPKVFHRMSICSSKYIIDATYGNYLNTSNSVKTESNFYSIRFGIKLKEYRFISQYLFLSSTYFDVDQSYIINTSIYIPDQRTIQNISSDDNFKFTRLCFGITYSVSFGGKFLGM